MLNLNYNINSAGLEKAKFTEQENEAFRPFQIQYVIVPAGGGAAAGNNSFDSGSDLPKVGIAGNGGVIASGSYCVQPLTSYPIVIGKGGAGGIKGTSTSFTGSTGGNSAFYNIEAFGGEGGKSQVYITSSTFAGNGASTSASIANGGSGSQWTYNLPGCLPDPFNPGCHGGQLISESYYSGGGAGIVVSGSVNPLTIEYIVIGGGGGGASYNQNPPGSDGVGGGGGGGVVTGSFVLEPSVTTYPIIVGAGGLRGILTGGGAQEFQSGQNGSGSSAFGVSTTGGEGGIGTLLSAPRGGNSGTGSWGNTTQYLGAIGLAAGGAGVTNSGSIGTTGPTEPERSGGRGGNGLQWVTGQYYGAGGGGAYAIGSTTYVGASGLGGGNFGAGGVGSRGNSTNNGISGSVIVRYFGTGSRLSGAPAAYDSLDGYTYHTFTASATLVYDQQPSQIFTSGLPGVGSGNSLFSISGSTLPIANTGGGAAATYYNQNGVSGSDGFVAIRYEGAPIAQGGNIVVTQFYTYHLFSSSGDFYVIGNETNPNINPCA
jgi:hypothetical protein